MLKLLGSLCVLSGGILFWMGQMRECRRELETLSDLSSALEEAAEEIRMTQRPLPVLLQAIQDGRSPEAARFFETAAQSAQSGNSLTQAWIRAAETLPLGEAERRILKETGHCLAGDEARIVQGLHQASHLLRQRWEEKRLQRPERERRTTALSFSAAALLVILLI